MLNAEGRFIRRLREINRKAKARKLEKILAGVPRDSVLLIGCGQGWKPMDVLVEQSVVGDASTVVGVDLHEKVNLPWPYVRGSGLSMPVRDGSFDVVLSNAVIEHVGGRPEQEVFVAEHLRAGRRWIITTPNRWFPLEPHTGVFLRHWGKAWRARNYSIITRALSRREFVQVLPAGSRVIGHWWSPTIIATGPGHAAADGANRTAPGEVSAPTSLSA